jgi:nitrite reductase/ring-hydroxylating ferredoxin subunit
MDFPASIAALEEQLAGNGEIAPNPELFHDPQVLAVERERIFIRPSIAVDHASRLAEKRRYFRFDAAGRSILVTRDGDGGLHALRNVCLHAGYPICEAEDGTAERLVCPYHGWEYSLDGRLVEPELSARIDPGRLLLARYRVGVRDGLILVDLSGGSGATPPEATALPPWLAAAAVCRRGRWSTAWNWKFALHFAKASPRLFLDDFEEGDEWHAFGPLSLILLRPNRAALLQIIPKLVGRTDFRLVELAAPDALPGAAAVADAIGEGLRRAVEADPSLPLDRTFFAWYWSLVSAPPE